MIKLSDRLMAIASFVDGTKRIIDVGTDHGYIPVYFALSDCAERIAASDIKNGPLMRARCSADEFGVEDDIEFILADGLLGCGEDFDEVIIAGMGGDTIISILEKATWVRDKAHLILQPQTKIDRLCSWLSKNGFYSDDAKLVKDAGKLYLVMSVRGGNALSEGFALYEFIWRHLMRNRDPLAMEQLETLIGKQSVMIAGMEKGRRFSDEQLEFEKQKLRELQMLLNEVKTW